METYFIKHWDEGRAKLMVQILYLCLKRRRRNWPMKVIIFPEPREATLQDITLHLSEWLLSKRQKISVDEDVEKRET